MAAGDSIVEDVMLRRGSLVGVSPETCDNGMAFVAKMEQGACGGGDGVAWGGCDCSLGDQLLLSPH